MAIDKILGYEYYWSKEEQKKYYVHRLIMEEFLGRKLKSNEHIHHIDGNRLNNDISNLKIVSPSEHTIEEQRLRGNIQEYVLCSVCGRKTKNIEFCSVKCMGLGNRKFELSKKELEKLISEYPMTKIGEMYGVSDNAIRNRCKLVGVDLNNRKFKKERIFRI